MQITEFNHIVHKIKDKMYRIAFRVVRNHEEACDVVQESLVKIWKKWDKLSEVENKEAYCMTITRNMAIDQYRSKKMDISNIDQHYDLKSGAANPERSIIAKDELKSVRAFINNLPEHHRAVLELRDIEGYSYKEISDITEYSLEQVKVYLFRARLRIKEHFNISVS